MATNQASVPPHGYPTRLIQGQVEHKFLCSSCKMILKHPIQSFCGHRFCKECIDYLIETGGPDVMCPSCHEEDNENEFSKLDPNQTFPDNAIKREFVSLHVKCANDGCDWNGTFKEYTKHEKVCQFKPVLCECGAEIQDIKMEEHKKNECPLRNVICPHCKIELLSKDLETHNLSCPAFPVTCPDCGQPDIPRNQLDIHTDLNSGDCTKPIQCPYGCEELVDRTKMKEHKIEKSDVHMDKLRERVEALEAQGGGRRQTAGAAREDIYEALTSRIQLLERNLNESKQTQPYVSQTYANSQVAVAAGLPTERAALAGSATASAGPGSNDSLLPLLEIKVEAFENMVAVLNAQLESSQKLIAELEQQRRIDRETLSTYETKTRNIERSMALKDVALAEQDLRIQSLESTGYEGILLWKIPDYSRRRQEAINGRTTSMYSPAFFTSRTGYKMCARIYLNGDGMGKGTHVSLFFVIMRGQYDALLRWPFRQKVTFMMLDQNNREHIIDAFRPDPSSTSFKQPVSDMNIASGCPLFIPHSNLENKKHAYVKDNTIFIKIIVDVSDLS